MSAPQFLNVDLIVESMHTLAPVLLALGNEVLILHAGKSPGEAGYGMSLELTRNYPQGREQLDQILRGFCSALEGLGPEPRRVWEQCRSRVFDIGLESGAGPGPVQLAIHPGTLQRIAALGATIAFTLYPMP